MKAHVASQDSQSLPDVSCDCHANEPSNLWPRKTRRQVSQAAFPDIEVDEHGREWVIGASSSPQAFAGPIFNGEDSSATAPALLVEGRLDDEPPRMAVDAEMIFNHKA